MRWAAVFFSLLLGCPSPPSPAEPDLSYAARGPAGLFEDCSPTSQDVICAEGLRCALVRIGDAPHEGTLVQCAPKVVGPLAEDMPCSFNEETEQPAGAAHKRFDRCAAGAGCVDTSLGPRCRKLCALRVQKQCGAGRLCVLPSPVTSLGYCAAPDGCAAVAAQRGCPAGPDGEPLPCYVLTESPRDGQDPPGGTFCLQRVPLGDSSGELSSRCERSANCRPGLSCVAQSEQADPTCRPYCALPPADGGIPDGGVACAADLGTCNAIAYYDRVGRCY